MDSSILDPTLVLLAVTSSVTAYFVLGFLSLAGSKLPLLVGVFLFTNMVSRTATFQGQVGRLIQQFLQKKGQFSPSSKSVPTLEENARFVGLSEVSQTELIEALVSLRHYAFNSGKTNERRRRLNKYMSWRQQKLCDEAGYLKKLKQIDVHTEKNQRLFDAVVAATDKRYGLLAQNYDQIREKRPASQNTSASNYRVVESLGHYVRDWTSDGEAEIAPMLHYIKAQLDKIVDPKNAAKTCVVVPGSGLGRVAQEVAVHGNYGAVHAVEFSGLMHACNQFIYEPSKALEHKIYPHVHKTSNFLDTQAQFREMEIPAGLPQPENLHLHLADFRTFNIPNREQYDTVVVVSAFFIDTAENILDYFDQIHLLTAPSNKTGVKNGHWINFGPLKYGSAAQAEFNAAEIAHIRKALGWVDHHRLNTIEDPQAEFAQSSVPGTGLSGYITDKQSLWQGYYGISMWASDHKTNEARRP